MIQLVQNPSGGELSLLEVPDPVATPGHVVIANRVSVISAGTERVARELARKSLIGKARERPDQVRRLLVKARQEGLLPTIAQAREKLGQPMALGYSSAGTVLAIGAGVEGLSPGDHVASNGPHAGVVLVPKHLCVPVPRQIPFEQAAFTVLGSIAIHGLRLAGVSLGDTVFVIGLGIVGQLTVALARAAGCRVYATDLDESRCELGRETGAQDASPDLDEDAVSEITGGLGADAVIVAAATDSDGPIEKAGNAVRKKGRIVVVGAVGMGLARRTFYMKEAEVVVSCSYGPGRYDPDYEERGRDYPAAYVRWTEHRNMKAVVAAMADGTLDVSRLVTHRVPIERAEEAYDLIESRREPFLGVLLEYPARGASPESPRRVELSAERSSDGIGIGCLGAGNFAGATLLPAIRDLGERVRLRAICSARGLSATDKGDRFGFESAVADDRAVIEDPAVDAVFIATRHDLHAQQTTRALMSEKHVFVEKPLAIDLESLADIAAAVRKAAASRRVLMVGFNRRFAPLATRLRAFFDDVRSPLTISVRFNAGPIPPDHWTQNERVGGGRIIGEACHAIDLATFLAGAAPVRVYAESVGGQHAPTIAQDQAFLTLRHANGSISSIGYLAGGDRGYPKERIEVFGGGRVGILDDFRVLTVVVDGKTRRVKNRRRDKGHRECVRAFVDAVIEGRGAPIPWHELEGVTRASILALQSMRQGMPVTIPEPATSTSD